MYLNETLNKQREIDNITYVRTFLKTFIKHKVNSTYYQETEDSDRINDSNYYKVLDRIRYGNNDNFFKQNTPAEDLGIKYANEFNYNFFHLAKQLKTITVNNYKVDIETFDKLVDSFKQELVCVCNFSAITYLKPYLSKYKIDNKYDTYEIRNITLYKLGNCIIEVYMNNTLNLGNDFVFHNKDLMELKDRNTDITYVNLEENSVLFYLECKEVNNCRKKLI